jgi:hypothetical protein
VPQLFDWYERKWIQLTILGADLQIPNFLEIRLVFALRRWCMEFLPLSVHFMHHCCRYQPTNCFSFRTSWMGLVTFQNVRGDTWKVCADRVNQQCRLPPLEERSPRNLISSLTVSAGFILESVLRTWVGDGGEWVTCSWEEECDVASTSERSGLMDCGIRFFQFGSLWHAIHLTGFYRFVRFRRWQCWTCGFRKTRFFQQLNWLANFCFPHPPLSKPNKNYAR